jgi:thiol-disulfide isomerase/thioredoxin
MIRKQFLLSVCMLMLTSFAIAQTKPFTIKGKMDGKNDGCIYLTYPNEQTKTVVLDSVLVDKGEFKFKGNLSGPSQAMLMMDRKGRTYDKILPLYIVPAEMKLKVDYDRFSDGELKGSSVQDEADQLKKAKAALMAQMKQLQDAYTKANVVYSEAVKAKKDEATLATLKIMVDSANNAMEPMREQLRKLDVAFMDKNPSSYVTATMLRVMIGRMLVQEGEKRYNSLADEVKNSRLGQELKNALEALRMGSPGSTAYVFAAKEFRGAPLSLADYKGKYVLIDFWASWCVPCRKGNPHLLSLYSKYKDKGFEIIGVASDDGNESAWAKAIEKDQIGVWKHVLRGYDAGKQSRGEKNPLDISDNYGIQTLPTKVLIDPQGIIIGRYGGSGENDEAMDKRLAEILGGS